VVDAVGEVEGGVEEVLVEEEGVAEAGDSRRKLIIGQENMGVGFYEPAAYITQRWNLLRTFGMQQVAPLQAWHLLWR